MRERRREKCRFVCVGARMEEKRVAGEGGRGLRMFSLGLVLLENTTVKR